MRTVHEAIEQLRAAEDCAECREHGGPGGRREH
jgi:hypothetical protein